MTRGCNDESRRGIAAGGNLIVDHIKEVDRLPGRGMLASIVAESRATGGAPVNVLTDLARMQTGLPLACFGLVGDDADGRTILDACRRHGIATDGVKIAAGRPTSYTDVMAERGGGARTFYHQRGANALFAPEHVAADRLTCRIFHLGYLLLLDAMDAPHPVCGTAAAALLRDLRAAGIRTSIDVVSEEGDRFNRIVPPALPFVDYLVINEIEAGRIAGKNVRCSDGSLDRRALRATLPILAEMGDTELIVVHMPEGAVYLRRDGREGAVGSLDVPAAEIRGTVGAGDAFCAGLLYGLHEEWEVPRALRLAVCAAAACLAHPSASGGLQPLSAVLELGGKYPPQTPPL